MIARPFTPNNPTPLIANREQNDRVQGRQAPAAPGYNARQQGQSMAYLARSTGGGFRAGNAPQRGNNGKVYRT